MPKVVGAKLAYSSNELWFNPVDLELGAGDAVIVKTAQGLEFASIVKAPFEVEREEVIEKTGKDWLQIVERKATKDDLKAAEKLQKEEAKALRIFKDEAKELNLDLKVVGVNYLFDESKAICYFSAEERVDFRELVKRLSSKLSKRIEMKQIGPRQEAALCGGIAHCGCEFCCAKWETEFSPVSIRMAKDQDLSINGDGISGACGRLMCCLRFETEAYRDFKKRAPKKGAKIQTPVGQAVVIGFNTPKEELELKFEESGKRVRISISDLTASSDAHKKAQENNCPLRPDTLSKEAFDALGVMGLDAAITKLDVEVDATQEEDTKPRRNEVKKTHGMRPKRAERKRRERKERQGEAPAKEPLAKRVKRVRKHKSAPQQQEAPAPKRDVRPGRSQRG